MCGIAGIVKKGSSLYTNYLERMVKNLAHRGPDEHGTYLFPNCALGHARLSIVDLSSGQQPMISDTVGITFNGEIYGYEKIKKELEKTYSFKTKSDTEVIIALYKKYGDSFVEHLPGMFSFAIWDDREQKMIAGRDRFGEKPFYYAYGPDNEFIFASEIKSILSTNLVQPILDTESINHYLQHLYIAPNKTIYKNIFTLPPAHYLVLSDEKSEVKKYWKLPKEKETLDTDEAVKQLQKLLNTSIQEQLVADVPVGAFLSGGLDSSTIVAIASKYKEKLKTFSFGFGDSKNELAFAKDIAQMYHTDHTELFPEKHDIAELLLTMQDVYDEPFADSSNIPTYLLSEAAKKHVTVVLTGDGGDELFAGYSNWYKPLLLMGENKTGSLPRSAILYTLAKFAFTFGLSSRKKMQSLYLGARFRQKYNSIVEAHASQNITFTHTELDKLLLPHFQTKHKHNTLDWKESSTVDDALRMDLEDYMPGDILVKIDRASMAHGLELRAPFLSKEFAEYAVAIPWHMKITTTEDKAVFRKAFSDLWTDKIKNRKKQGFGAPVSEWLVEASMISLKEKILKNPDSKIFKIMSFEKAQRFIDENSQKTWTLLVLALWMEKHTFTYE